MAKRQWIILAAIVVGVAAATLAAYFALLAPRGQIGCEEWLESGPMLAVDRHPFGLAFLPPRYGQTGLIIYPGARISHEAYAPLAGDVASRGYPVFIVEMPFGYAALQPDKALEVMAAFPQVNRWIVAGHGLGGAMAARFAHEHLDRVAGLVLLGAYPEDDLSRDELLVLSVYGSLDGVTTVAAIQAKSSMLPPSPATRFSEISGGNHAQFAWFGSLPDDGAPTIDAKQQTFAASSIISRMMSAIDAQGKPALPTGNE
jgi:pimeloyl-ACP methyl ester carboxylesterase